MIDTTLIKEAEKLLEKEMKKIVDKGDLTPAELDNLKKALCIADMLNSFENGMPAYDPENSYSGWNIRPETVAHYGEQSYGRGRSPVTGRYISRGMNSMGNAGYSGHSIEDRQIAVLEQMMDSAGSEYERQKIQETINNIRMGTR